MAAFSVVVFHAPAWWTPLALPHAYLAVDLSFALTGFAIASAYEDRLAAG